MTLKTYPVYTTYLMIILAALIGGGGLLAFMLFLFSGPFNLINLDLSELQALLLDAFLCLIFFVQHSGMARRKFNQWAARFLPAQYRGLIYAIVSGIFTLLLVAFWQESTQTLIAVQGPWSWPLRAVFFLSIIGVLWTLGVGFLPLFRVQPVLDELRGTDPQQRPLIVHGPFRWVRHPLFLFSLLMIWSYPVLTLDRLLLNLLFTIWVIVATLLEERHLAATFGEEYRSYQRRVPRLIPWRRPWKKGDLGVSDSRELRVS